MPDQIDENLEQPLGDGSRPGPVAPEDDAFINDFLELDQILAGDVRRAEDTHRIFLRPDLLAEISALEDKLETLVEEDDTEIEGIALKPDPLAASGERALGEEPTKEPARKTSPVSEAAKTLVAEIAAVQAEYRKHSGLLRLRQLDGDEWEEFRTHWRKDLDKGTGDLPQTFWNQLISKTVIQPAMTVDQVAKMRKSYGEPQVNLLGRRCFALNTQGGVSVPKSRLSSDVQRLLAREQS